MASRPRSSSSSRQGRALDGFGVEELRRRCRRRCPANSAAGIGSHRGRDLGVEVRAATRLDHRRRASSTPPRRWKTSHASATCEMRAASDERVAGKVVGDALAVPAGVGLLDAGAHLGRRARTGRRARPRPSSGWPSARPRRFPPVAISRAAWRTRLAADVPEPARRSMNIIAGNPARSTWTTLGPEVDVVAEQRRRPRCRRPGSRRR